MYIYKIEHLVILLIYSDWISNCFKVRIDAFTAIVVQELLNDSKCFIFAVYILLFIAIFEDNFDHIPCDPVALIDRKDAAIMLSAVSYEVTCTVSAGTFPQSPQCLVLHILNHLQG